MSSPEDYFFACDEGDIGGPFEAVPSTVGINFLDEIKAEFAERTRDTWKSAEEPAKAEKFVDDMN